MKAKKEKEILIKLYEDSLNDIIWTHKIQATYLDELKLQKKIYMTIKEVIVGLSGFASAVCIYLNKIQEALIVNAISSLAIIIESIFKLNEFDNKIKNTNISVNELWFMKKELQFYKEYLENDIISFEIAKEKLENALKDRKNIYSNLETAPNRVVKKAQDKLLNRKDEEINKEFFKKRG